MIDYKNKYLKYKNKYLKLKGGQLLKFNNHKINNNHCKSNINIDNIYNCNIKNNICNIKYKDWLLIKYLFPHAN